MSIELTHCSKEHLPVLKGFELPEEQRRFTALPRDVMQSGDGQYPIVIVSEGTPVGFFLLHSTERVKDYSTNPNAMLLTALSIDHRQQRKGFAKKGLLKLASFIKQEFKHCDEIVLVVNQKNIPARRLYEKAGFADTGKRKIGPIGEQIVMKMHIQSSR
ncbi:GNAT family N-acetyltransferase [Bacillus glycinifermentans]|uniref:Acetyltransferase n=1 Tax=Bacillus glycinifermentans TaxID=1664069 RepID=A0A0T6BJA3_9BACI|nr:GNAT family N-acetyltransferase [Bacillus glycinifermentans]KRT89973.1 acetyltransferase [Bacillus glycinifermentans]MEC0483644.1 GNAT family N-acetyltransferase [Bacillus glycinifermentans]